MPTYATTLDTLTRTTSANGYDSAEKTIVRKNTSVAGLRVPPSAAASAVMNTMLAMLQLMKNGSRQRLRTIRS